MNYFELYGLPVSLKVNKQQLAQSYIELQKKHHPDFFSQETEYEQAEALELSSEVNKAYNTFKNEDATIKYVLQLKGLLQEEEKYQLPPDFLMEVMELNETLSEGTSPQIDQFSKEIFDEVKDIIENYNDSSITTAALLKVKEYYFKKKYLQRILERLVD